MGQGTEGNDVEGEEDPTDETYNTRYKGVKWVKVPPADDNEAAKASASSQPKPVKCGRERPRKSGGSEKLKCEA